MNREEVSEEFLNTYNYYVTNNFKPIILKVGNRPEAKYEDRNKDIKISFYLNNNTNIYDIISLYRLENNIDCLLVENSEYLEEKSLKELIKILTILHIPIIFFYSKENIKVRKKVNS